MEQRLFDSFWQEVLKHKYRETAVFSDDCSSLLTFQDIEEERAVWRRRLSTFSCGDCIVAAIGNNPSWPAFLMACWDQALVVAPIEPDLPASQLDGILRLTRAQAIVRGIGIQRFDCSPLAWNGQPPCLLKITSGTTGAPRAVRFRESQLLADCRNICETMGIRPDDVNFGVIPLSHSYGFSNLITPLLYQGTSLVCSTDRLPRAVYNHLQSCRATVFPGTPALFQALGSLPDIHQTVGLRLCVSAGAPLAPEVSRQFHRRFALKIHSFYGSSECGGIAYDRSEDLERPNVFVGTPLNGVKVTKIDDGRISVRGPNVADGYFPVPEIDVLDGTQFVPDDIIAWTPLGLQLIGRVSDFVNVAGKKVHPSTIEEHLRKLPGVIDVIVFGIPSTNRNEELVAYVVAGSDISRQDLENHCRDGLSSWQVPREFRMLSELPFNQRGKINRSELARLHLTFRSRGNC
ncbi:MAG: acyl--CoA ligase [Verrucomicrobia bacterium]|nr:acyl--CoA ligase [Verrucomicrobiota bacterium]